MLSRTKKTVALGVSAVCLMMYSSQSHAATSEVISIGVAANFVNTVSDIVSAFKSANGYTDNNISYHSDSSANLKACVLATSGAVTTLCAGGKKYDLFLSADTASPAAVSTEGMVYSGVTQTPFFYATGSLVLAAKTTNIADCPTPAAGDSCGLPTTGSTIYTHFVIADPSKAPYGLAAMQVINQAPWSLGLSTTSTYPVATFPASYVYTSANIGTTFSSVNAATPSYAYGFVAKSQVCKNGSLGAWKGTLYITKAFEYKYDGSSSPNFGHTGTTAQTYPQIVQNGIPIENGQTTATKAEVIAFENFIFGTTGTNLRTQYCYGVTAPS